VEFHEQPAQQNVMATVISNPSLDSDELKFFRRFLPTIDPTGKTP
jgi:hypothetical protein